MLRVGVVWVCLAGWIFSFFPFFSPGGVFLLLLFRYDINVTYWMFFILFFGVFVCGRVWFGDLYGGCKAVFKFSNI